MENYTGYLRVVVDKKREKTIVKDSFFQGALKITRPIYLDDSGQACLYMMNPGGGYLEGDVYKIEIHLEPESELLLTTQSSTKIYKTLQFPAVQETEIFLKNGSILEYIPDPTIAYQHARYKQSTVIRMEQGSTLIYSDILTPGWAPDGTLFQYDMLHSKMEVYMGDELILWDQLKLTPDIEFQGIGMMEGYTHYGSMLVINEKATQEFIDTTYDLLDAEGLKGKFGLSMLTVPGFILRVLANTTQETEKIFEICHRLIRESWFNKKSVFLRKY